MQPEFHLSDAGEPAARDAILSGLAAFNEKQTGSRDFRPLAVLLRDESGATVGGLWGRTAWKWLFIELLFVPEKLRRGGVGRELMRRAEAEAAKRGCHLQLPGARVLRKARLFRVRAARRLPARSQALLPAQEAPAGGEAQG
jgi:GNAT superfamily N-acetyltransferase